MSVEPLMFWNNEGQDDLHALHIQYGHTESHTELLSVEEARSRCHLKVMYASSKRDREKYAWGGECHTG